MTTVATAGQYTGQTIAEIARHDWKYIVWAAGYKRVDNSYNKRFDNFVKETCWDQRDTCDCDGYGVWRKHASTCYMAGLGRTLDESYARMAECIIQKTVQFKAAICLRPWLVLRQHAPDFVTAADEFLCGSNQCWECGRPLVAVGDARSNGKAHEDWDARRLHKKCLLPY